MIWSGWSDFPIEENMMDADLNRKGEGRPPGLHLSGVLKHIAAGMGEKYGAIPGDQPFMRMQEGFLWEKALEYMIGGLSLDDAIGLAFKRWMVALRSDIVTQIQVEKDGIHMTPDGFNKTKGELESYKCTRKSFAKAADISGFESNHWMWLMQEQAYAYALGVDTVHWIVLFQAGDYSIGKGSGPRTMQGTMVFTPEELVANWNIILANAKGAAKEE